MCMCVCMSDSVFVLVYGVNTLMSPFLRHFSVAIAVAVAAVSTIYM